MIQEKGQTPWHDGHYVCERAPNMHLLVEAGNITMEVAGFKEDDELSKVSWEFGDFGDADHAVAEVTGKNVNNWHMESWGGVLQQKGVLSDDGKKVTFINMLKELDTYQWVGEEEFEKLKNAYDPVDAPPNPYKHQPQNLGKFLFISGPPGSGKSTTGLLLSKMAGYVYYEADCFVAGTNPYLPPSTKEPSMEAVKQKPLKGISQERKEAVSNGAFPMMNGKDYCMDKIKRFYSAMCKDLDKERRRLGGDWAVARAVPFRSLRDHIRAQLGPQLLFVVLNVKKKDQKKRISARHGESEDDDGDDMNSMLEKEYDLHEPATTDEPNAINVEITANMTREEVVKKFWR